MGEEAGAAECCVGIHERLILGAGTGKRPTALARHRRTRRLDSPVIRSMRCAVDLRRFSTRSRCRISWCRIGAGQACVRARGHCCRAAWQEFFSKETLSRINYHSLRRV
jgi:hypothetical protein